MQLGEITLLVGTVAYEGERGRALACLFEHFDA
jgi:hypothetical protein